LIACGNLIVISSALAGEWEWDLRENAVTLGIADADWAISKDFQGTKLLLDAHYVFKQAPGEQRDSHRFPEKFIGVVDVDLQWGTGDTSLEIGKLTLTPYAMQWDIRRDTDRKLTAVLDQAEFGVIQYSFDDPLGIDSYTELTIARVGRTWNYKWSKESAFNVVFGLKVSTGWAWAESIAPQYSDVSNPFTGFGATLGLAHDKWGMIYTDDRIVAGYTLGSPTGESISREARIRFGYYKQFYRCLVLDVFLEKRSFNFADANLPDLYTKSKRTGAEIGCKF
jgi:hypothetical protein